MSNQRSWVMWGPTHVVNGQVVAMGPIGTPETHARYHVVPIPAGAPEGFPVGTRVVVSGEHGEVVGLPVESAFKGKFYQEVRFDHGSIEGEMIGDMDPEDVFSDTVKLVVEVPAEDADWWVNAGRNVWASPEGGGVVRRPLSVTRHE